ncbi:MAG: hypothetical protein ACR2RD_10095 [Woeseiaceae bacterium]
MSIWAKFSNKGRSGAKAPREPQQAKNQGYRGVKVCADTESCCQMVRTITDERFLLEEAPMLPLSLCDAQVCNCTYERFNDRRGALRRASDFAFDINSELFEQENRNNKLPGRRRGDLCEF